MKFVNVQRLQMTDNVNQDTNDAAAFIEQANSSPRKLGHNKLQLEIDDLNKQIDAWKLADAQKEIKLDLFKKTIANLQNQLQEKSARITQLETNIHTDIAKADVERLGSVLSDKDVVIADLQSDIDNLKSQLQDVTTRNERSQGQLQQSQSVLDQNQSEITTLKALIHEHVATIQGLESENMLLKQQLTMKENVLDSAQPELDSLREELAVYKTKLAEQVQLTIETENQLQTQLEHSQESLSADNTEMPRVIGVTKKKNTRGDPKKRR